jgi:hypothetical protein
VAVATGNGLVRWGGRHHDWYASRVEGFLGRVADERVQLHHAEDGQLTTWTLAAEWRASWNASEIRIGCHSDWAKGLRTFAKRKQQSQPRPNRQQRQHVQKRKRL